MKSVKIGMLALVGATAMGVAGCANTAPPVPANDPYGGMGIHITVQAPLDRWLRVGQLNVKRDGLMAVVVPVRLAYDDPNGYYIQYKFTFLDQSGKPIAAQTEWRLEQLAPRVEKILTGTALDSAADWRLEIKAAKGGVH